MDVINLTHLTIVPEKSLPLLVPQFHLVNSPTPSSSLRAAIQQCMDAGIYETETVDKAIYIGECSKVRPPSAPINAQSEGTNTPIKGMKIAIYVLVCLCLILILCCGSPFERIERRIRRNRNMTKRWLSTSI